MMLDVVDRKILSELEMDSGISMIKLARKVRKSKETTLYRFNRLRENGVLRSCTAIVDMSKLGYMTFRFYIKWQNMDLSEKKRFYEEIGRSGSVWTTTELHGKWDFAFFLGLKVDEYAGKFHQLWDSMLERYKPMIADHKIAIYAPIYNFNKRFLFEEKVIVARVTGEGKPVDHDDLDEKILFAYSPDVRQGLVSIAKACHTSVETVRRRIHELERKKVIVGYKIDLDLAKLGYQGYRVDFSLNSAEKNAEIFEYLKHSRYFYQINKSIGGADIEAEVVVKDLKHLLEILEDVMIRFKGVIKNYEYMGYTDFPKLSMIPG